MDDNRPNGRAGTLRSMFTAFLVTDVFAVGVDASDPDFRDGSILVFSGDDEFYWAITDRLDAGLLDDFADVLERAGSRLDQVSPPPARPRGSRRIISAFVQDEPPAAISPEEIRKHRGILAAGSHFAAVLSSSSPRDEHPSVHLFFRPDGEGDWTRLKQFHPFWLDSTRKAVTDARDGIGGHVPAMK